MDVEVRCRCQVEYNDSTLAVASHVDPVVGIVCIWSFVGREECQVHRSFHY